MTPRQTATRLGAVEMSLKTISRDGPVLLRPMTLDECLRCGRWRADPAIVPTLRTVPKSDAEQRVFYDTVVAHAPVDHAYWAVVRVGDGVLVGMGGLTHRRRWPGEAEISLLIGPPYQGYGLGTAAVRALLDQAFGPDQLDAVVGEAYRRPGGAAPFWEHLGQRQGWAMVRVGPSLFFRIGRTTP